MAFEKEPLSMSFGVEIVLKPKVVLYVVHFRSFTQVTRFEAAVKHQHVVQWGH